MSGGCKPVVPRAPFDAQPACNEWHARRGHRIACAVLASPGSRQHGHVQTRADVPRHLPRSHLVARAV